MSFDFDPYTLMAGLLFGSAGMWMAKHAWKETHNMRVFYIALVMMVYPYFVTDPWICWGAGSALCYGAYRCW